jgi:hypothetical protein
MFFETNLLILVHIIAFVCFPCNEDISFQIQFNVRMDYSFTFVVNPCVPLDLLRYTRISVSPFHN